MKIGRHLTYANVTATLALFVAMATGGAYAASKIGTSDIKKRAVSSAKIKKRAIRGGVHVRNNSVTGKNIREQTVNALAFSAIDGTQRLDCDPTDAEFVDCASVTLRLPRAGRALVVATGGSYSAGNNPASGRCEVRIDGEEESLADFPGEEATANTSAFATNGFARTLVTPRLASGAVELALACNQAGSPDFRVGGATIAAIALTNGRR